MNNENTDPEKKGADMVPLTDFDQNHFYETDHIDKEHFAEQNRSNEDLVYQEISGTVSLADRIADDEKADEHKTHELGANPSPPTEEDGKKLMDVGRAPDS